MLFTKEEEYAPLSLDKHGRMPSSASVHGPPFVPAVSQFLVRRGMKIEYPNGGQYALCLTHDIDFLNYWSYFRLTRELGRSEMLRRVMNYASRQVSGVWNFEDIGAIEDRFGSESTFFIMSVDFVNDDFNYLTEDIVSDFSCLSASRWEIGLHGSRSACSDVSGIASEKRSLERTFGRSIDGYRNHFLKFVIPDSWRYLHENEFKYDSTLGYADSIGFRNGMCHPFQPYDLNTRSTIRVLEIPLTIMDQTLFDYMKYDFDTAWKAVESVIKTVKENTGVLTLLWHNTYMKGKYGDFYRRILKKGMSENAWMTTAGNVARWWSKNSPLNDGDQQ